MPAARLPHVDRRALLIGGGAGAGLLLAWGLWPRDYAPNLAIAPGETVLNAFLKIGADGRVVVVVPQAELGQGVWTALPQALADELGADWRQIAVEPAPIHPLYANTLIAEQAIEDRMPEFLAGAGRWAAHEYATRTSLMLTAGSTSIRAFEQRFREAGATARALLCMAAGKRLGADWRACDTEQGFVVRGPDRLRFGELAAEAAAFRPPARPPLRRVGEGGLSGRALPRVDLAAKVDGSARYAADVRLPGLAYAAIRHGPLGRSRPAGLDKAAAEKVPGMLGVIENPRWVATVAQTSWAAMRGLDALGLRFATEGPLPDSAATAKALAAALPNATSVATIGPGADRLEGAGVLRERYTVPLAAHAAIEPLVATARTIGDRLEVWAPTQAHGLMRDAVARSTGYAPGRVTVFPMPAGGGFGRKIEVDAAVEAAQLAIAARRPVQLTWARAEEMQHARHRPPALGEVAARLGPGGRIVAWRMAVATPSAAAELGRRLMGRGDVDSAEAAALEGGLPPYALPAATLAHAPVATGFESGMWRSVARSYTTFFAESFVDELAARAAIDPLTFRIAMLGSTPRLARCLQQAAATAGWSGEPKAGQGIALASAYGSHIALVAEIAAEGGSTRVTRLTAAIDCGRTVNPGIVRQQIEGGLVFGLAATFGDAVSYTRGLIDAADLASLRLPTLADTPQIAIELMSSAEAPGGVAELAVPVVAPAVANAIASATGRRLRSLPLA